MMRSMINEDDQVWKEEESEEEEEDSIISASEDDDDEEEDISNGNGGPLYQLSDLMDQLPIKRGLSKYYNGKSQTFTSLGSANSVQDLSKNNNNHMQIRIRRIKKMNNKASSRLTPKPTISKKKKKPNSSSSSSSSSSSRLSLLIPSFPNTTYCFTPHPPVKLQLSSYC